MPEKPDKPDKPAHPEKRTVTYAVFEQLEDGTWRRAVEVTVPSKTRERTVIEKAITELGHDNGEATLMVVTAEDAKPVTVRFEEQPPKLVIV